MAEQFDFDQILNREGTNSLKYDGRKPLFGRADVIPMWVADMDFASPPAVTQALLARANSPIYGYTDFPDSLYDAMIAWIKKRHGWAIKREWIMMCPGVVPSLHTASIAFAAHGESIIVQPPVYFPFFSSVKNTGRTLVENKLILQNNRYTIDFEALEECAKQAKMLFLCSPHNPVGRVWRQEELARIINIAEKYQLVVFSDEIHADLIYPEGKHHPLASLSDAGEHIVTAVAPSKTFNIAGLGLSALIVPNADYRQKLYVAFETLHVSVANPFSLVAFEAAYAHGEAWLDALLTYLTTTRDYVIDYLDKHISQIKCIKPEGTYLLWLDCTALGLSDQALKHFFIHQAGIGLSPGTLFGEGGSGFMRMNIGMPRQLVKEALDNIRHALNLY
ncbi:MAG: MalY/PatB family protein [Methylotenera sp.]